jgi:hypothetical protein
LAIEVLLWTIPFWLIAPRRNINGNYRLSFSHTVVGLFLGFALMFMFYPVAELVIRANGSMHLATQTRKIAIAIHEYHEVHQKLPPATILSAEGRPLLSWRVAILPQLGYETLYKEFRLDEPWDGPNNSRLLERMPRVYGKPLWCRSAPPHHTYYQLFVGPGALFEIRKERTFKELQSADGLSLTIMGGWAEHAVPWTKPEDMTYSPHAPVAGLGPHLIDPPFPIGAVVQRLLNLRHSEVVKMTVMNADGSIQRLGYVTGQTMDFEKLRPFITWNGGEKVEWPW